VTDPPSDPYAGLGDAIRELRLERGVTRAQVKDAAEISLEYLGKIEQGRRNPQPDVLARISAALGSTTAELLDRARSPRRGLPDLAAGPGGLLMAATAGSAFGASVSLVRAVREIRRQRTDREQLLAELQRRLSGLSDDELALLLASLPQETDETDAGQSDPD
jgi:transcriptional regulator with XRE-family HTH domain